MTARQALVLALLAGALLVGGLWLARTTAQSDQEATQAVLARRLERLALRVELQPLLGARWQALWPRLCGRPGDDPALAGDVAAWRRRHGGDGCELWLFTPAGDVLSCWPATARAHLATAAAALFAYIRRPLHDPQPPTAAERAGIAALLGPERVAQRLRDRPTLVRSLRPLGRRTWGAWSHDPAVDGPGRVAGALVFWHRERLGPTARLRWLLAPARRRGEALGFAARWRPEQALPPPGVASATLAAAVHAWAEGGGDCQPVPGGVLLLREVGDGFVLAGRLPATVARLPAWWLAVAGLLLAVAWRQLTAPAVRLRLAVLVAGLLACAAGLPLAVLLAFSAGFTASRQQTAAQAELADMTRQLIEIDKLMPTRLRRSLALLRREVAARPAEELTAIQTRLDTLERARVFDLALVVDEEGRHRRGFSNFNTELDHLLALPERERRQALLDFVAQGHPATPFQYRFVWNWAGGAALPPRRTFPSDSPELDKSIGDTAAALGRDLLRRINAGRGGAGGESDSATSLVLGSMLESAGGSLLHEIHAELGRFYEIGSANRVAQTWSDILYDRDGRGRYYVFTFHDMSMFDIQLLRDLFAGRLGRPRDLRLAALAQQYHHQFPDRATWRRLQPLFALLPPEQRTLARVVRPRGRRPFLLAACRARHILNYVLVGTRPWARVEARQRAFTAGLAEAGLALLLALALLGWRLAGSLLTPARALAAGMAAMARGDDSHRIRPGTGDEWEGLAEAFNRTLAGMREQDMARVVQERLLLRAPLATGGVSFRGQNTMTSAVGGDFYDAHLLADGRLAFFVGDVSGHGVSAALVVAMVKAGFEAILRAAAASPGAVLDRLGRLLVRHLKRAKMMTAVAGLVAPDGSLVLANAGHPWPVLLVPGAAPAMVRQIAYPLGTGTRRPYADVALTLPVGGRLVLYSDGISEASAPDGAVFGFDRLLAALAGGAGRPAELVVADLLTTLRAFTRDEPWHDDVSLAVLARD